MHITDLLTPDGIVLGASPATKEEALELLFSLLEKSGNLSDPAGYKAAVLAREEQGTTAIGEGIAVPHAKSDCVKTPGLAAMTVPGGVAYGAPDGQPVRLLFMIAAAPDGDLHLEILSRLMGMLMEPDFTAALQNAKTAGEFLALIDGKEAETCGKRETAEEKAPHQKTEDYRVLAVTACPTGIAHTFMAAEALEKKAREMGVFLKVETNGSTGVKNQLTADEIAAADGIIVAADRKVEMARFDGKQVVIARVADGIHKPGELIETILNKKAPVYHHGGGAPESAFVETGTPARRLYRHLMNGLSHLLPFMTGGGILTALAFLLDNATASLLGPYMNATLAAFFKTVGDAAFGLMLPVFAGYIAMSIADRPGLMVGFAGGAIAGFGVSFACLDASASVSSGFLGAMLAGFISGYLVLGVKKLCNLLPRSLEGIKPVLLYPLAGLLCIGAVMCAINPLAAVINNGITDFLNRMDGAGRIVLGCLLGGMMSVNMGGPVNKAAYVFGVASVANGHFDSMAAVMVGGMIPPLAIALATTFFKNKFTPQERRLGAVNYIKGLCFITEGAIPFAAADPGRVVPACVAGSALAGGLSMAFGCTLRVPHGGLFVFPLAGNALGYAAALAAGSVVGMLMLALLKKRKAA